MSFKNSRDNLTANIALQISGLLIAIIVPILLGVTEYVQITVISVLISLISIADLGISTVYSRKLPALYSANDINEVRIWNATFIRFKFYTGIFFALVVSMYYAQRFDHILNAILLFVFIFLTVVTLFINANSTVQSDFEFIKKITITQSIAKVFTIPAVWFAGVKGWFLGQILAILVVFFNKKTAGILKEALNTNIVNWKLISDNIAQGILFSLISTLWLQLVSGSRFYASFAYPDLVVAQYGLLSSIYQIVIALSIAAFVPQTIKVYRLLEQDEGNAINYALKLAVYAAPVFVLFSFVLTYISPFVVDRLFPKYHVDKALYAPLMLSLFNMGLMITQGSVLIGFGKAKSYLTIVISACGMYFLYIAILNPYAGYKSAAIAQLLALSTYSIAILLLVYSIVKDKVENKKMMLLAGAPSALAPFIYFFLFYS